MKKVVCVVAILGVITNWSSIGWSDSYIGTIGSNIGEFDRPIGLAIDESSGKIYIVDSMNHRIQVFDTLGNYISTFGSKGMGLNEMEVPVGIAVNTAGEIYVSDVYYNRIQVFDSTGHCIRAIGKKNMWGDPIVGSDLGEFMSPVGIDVDSDGNLYVADQGNARIQVLDSMGNAIKSFGSYGTGVGQFINPYGVAVDSQKNIYVADYSNSRVQKFDSNGVFLFSIGAVNALGNPVWSNTDGGFTGPIDLKVDDNDNIYVVDRNSGDVEKFKNDGTYLETLFKTEGFNYPEGIMVYGKNSVFVSDTYNNRVKWADIPVVGLSVSGDNGGAINTSGGSIQMQATLQPTFATNKNVSWQVIDGTGKATIDASGRLSALKNGTVTVLAAATDGSGISNSTVVNISGQITLVSGIAVSGDNGNAINTSGGAIQMHAVVTPADATDTSVNWKVTNGTGEAHIDSGGMLCALKNGTVTVTATANDASLTSGSAVVTICSQRVFVNGIAVVSETGKAYIDVRDGTLKLIATVSPVEATDHNVVWYVVNGTGEAVINGSGVLSAVKDGIVTVFATSNDGTDIVGSKIISISNQNIKDPDPDPEPEPEQKPKPETGGGIVNPPSNETEKPIEKNDEEDSKHKSQSEVDVEKHVTTTSSETVKREDFDYVSVSLKELIDCSDSQQNLQIKKNGICIQIMPKTIVSNNLRDLYKEDPNGQMHFKITNQKINIQTEGVKDIGFGGFDIQLIVDSKGKKTVLDAGKSLFLITVDLTQMPLASLSCHLTAVGYKANTATLWGGFYNRQKNNFSFYTENLGAFTLGSSEQVTSMLMTIDSQKVLVNDAEKQVAITPHMNSGKAMIPIRYVAETFGAGVEWRKSEQTVCTVLEQNKEQFYVADSMYGVVPMNINGRVLVPTEYFGDKFGCKVFWIPASQEIVVIHHNQSFQTDASVQNAQDGQVAR